MSHHQSTRTPKGAFDTQTLLSLSPYYHPGSSVSTPSCETGVCVCVYVWGYRHKLRTWLDYTITSTTSTASSSSSSQKSFCQDHGDPSFKAGKKVCVPFYNLMSTFVVYISDIIIVHDWNSTRPAVGVSAPGFKAFLLLSLSLKLFMVWLTSDWG